MDADQEDTREATPRPDPTPLARMLARGLARRCPLCGSADLFDGWLEQRAACSGCGIRTDRGESDFFLGGYTLNFIVAELLLAGVLALVVLVTWPDVPWNGLMWGGGVAMVVAPILFFPVSRTLWLAIDLALRPPTPADFDDGPKPRPGRTS